MHKHCRSKRFRLPSLIPPLINQYFITLPSKVSARVWSVFLLLAITVNVGATNSQIAEQKGYSVGEIPDWVNLVEVSGEAKESTGQSVKYLLVDKQFNTLENGKQRFMRYVVSPQTSSGLTEASEINWTFNPEYQTIIIHQLLVTREGKTRDLTNSITPRFLQQEPDAGDLIHMGRVTVHYNLPDIRVGDLIEYSASINGINPVFGDKAFGFTGLNWVVPVDDLYIRILGNNDLKVAIENVNGKLKKTKKKNHIEYLYKDSATQVVNDEGNYPHDVTPYGWLQYSEYHSWNQVEEWANNLYETYPVPQSLLDISSRIQSESKNTEEYIQKAIQFVQNDIRYLGLEFGQNTHLPRNPSEILSTRFGDCKDKALLIKMLLAQVGVQAYPALVNTSFRAGIEQYMPTPGAFDHVINRVEYNNKVYWIDGTRTYQGAQLGELSQFDYGYSLVIGDKSQGLVKMFDQPPRKSDVYISESYHIDDFNKDITYNVKSVYRGTGAEYQRYRFANNTLSKITDEYLNFYRRYIKDVEIRTPIKYEDNVDKNEVVIYESYTVKNLVEEKENGYEIPIRLSIFPEYLPKPELQQREMARSLGVVRNITSEFSIHFASDLPLRFDDKPIKYEHGSFDYQYFDTYNRRVYTHTAELNINKDRIEAGTLASYIETRKKVANEWDFTITISKDDLKKGNKEYYKLLDRLKQLQEEYRE